MTGEGGADKTDREVTRSVVVRKALFVSGRRNRNAARVPERPLDPEFAAHGPILHSSRRPKSGTRLALTAAVQRTYACVWLRKIESRGRPRHRLERGEGRRAESVGQ